MRAELGEHLEEGAPLLTIYANDEGQLAAARERLSGNSSPFTIGAERAEPPPLIYETLTG